ncbi:ATP-binding protein [Pseudomonas sp.]|uniref:ATP-binding protein n=1 Tax=Pseudomonas sp. TaxID=306 RepID=UPI0025E72ED2|nr:ATP-binding protein [Pseudomonas sp.]
MKIRYRITDKYNKILFCNLLQKEIETLPNVTTSSTKIADGRARCGAHIGELGTVYAFTNDREFVASSSKFRTTLDAIANSLTTIKEIISESNERHNTNTRRLIHNLTSLNAHNIQEVYSLIPQDVISRRTGTHVDFVEKIVKEEPRDTALALLRIAKHNAAMKAEFSVFKKLFTSTPSLDPRYHNTHKVLMNIFYLFFPDFTEKEVRVEIGESSHTAFFDYESIHVALYHIIENATKYIKQKSDLKVNIHDSGAYTTVEMDMISIKISEKEKLAIFEEGVSGEIPKKLSKSGDGVGLNRVKKIIELNNGHIELITHPSTSEQILGIPYQRNVFCLHLPRRHEPTLKD